MYPRHKNNNKSQKINHDDDDDRVSKLNGSICNVVIRSWSLTILSVPQQNEIVYCQFF